MSSYPPPPPATTGGTAPPPDSPQQGADPDSSALQSHVQQLAQHAQHAHLAQPHPQYVAEAAAAAAAAVAHHGLQALQAAAAAPASVASSSPVTPQHAPLSDPSYLAGPPVGVADSPHNPKATRLRRACDMCSQRKVKCDETQPCKPCRDLGVDCTFNRTMKRRGPPNKHAEAAKAAKQARLEPNISPGPHNAAETLISIAGAQDPQQLLDAEAIAPWPVLTLLIDDFFTYIHPLAPFPHEPTFRMSFTARQDRTDRGFLALLASMIGCLVASFPRTARLHLKSQQHGMQMYPKAITLIERCRTVALEARGATFYSRDEVSVYDAATSYFLSLAAAYTMQWKLFRRFMAESMTFIRELGYHKPRDLGSSMFGVTYRGPSFNHVEDQLGKRIFWCLFLGLRSMYQLGSHHSDLVLPPPTPGEPYPEYPVEVDDQYILPQQILGQPEGVVSLITAFNQGIKIYMTMNGLVSIEVSYGLSILPFHDQKMMLNDSLQAVKQVMEGLPRALTIDLNSNGQNHGLYSLLPTGPPANIFEDGSGGSHYFPISYPGLQQQHPTPDFRHTASAHPERRRLLQYEIQKANIYASQLATRSYYVEHYLNLRDAHREHARAQAVQASFANGGMDTKPIDLNNHHHPHQHHDHHHHPDISNAHKSLAAAALHASTSNPNPSSSTQHPTPNPTNSNTVPTDDNNTDPIDAAMTAERELIVSNLLTVLAAISQRSMEPNGASLINKIRQVASTLVNDAPERRGPVAVRAQESLTRFVEILMRLERIPPGGGGSIGSGGAGGGGGLGGNGVGVGVGGGGRGVGDESGGVGGGGGVAGIGVGEDEEVELRNWADLREHQVRFLQGGGFMGLP